VWIGQAVSASSGHVLFFGGKLESTLSARIGRASLAIVGLP
jgi:hypothetical protein